MLQKCESNNCYQKGRSSELFQKVLLSILHGFGCIRRDGEGNDFQFFGNLSLVIFTNLGRKLIFMQLWCCSQPFVLILHGKQEEKANAIAFWDCFHSNDRKPFQIMEHVPWGIMSPALNRIFQYLSNTTRSLSLKNLEYLGQKLLRTQPTEQSMVPATSFLVLEARNNNFWSWFCKAADLVKPDPLRPKPKPQETEPETISRSIFLNVPWNQG